jgi:uncharacterized RDD family membrane protein YckC
LHGWANLILLTGKNHAILVGKMDWYYAVNSQRMGPVSQDEIQRLVDRKEIPLNSLVWHEGMDQWKNLSEMGDELDLDAGNLGWQPAGTRGHGEGVRTMGEHPEYVTRYLTVRRALAWMIDLVIYSTIAGVLSLFLYSRIDANGEQFLKDYRELQRPWLAQEADSPDPVNLSLTGKIDGMVEQTKAFYEKYPQYTHWQTGVVFGLWVLVETLMTVYLGGSLGKLCLRLRIYSPNGQRVQFYQSIGKSIIRAMEATLLILLVPVSAIMIVNTSRHRSLSDAMSQTLVRGNQWKPEPSQD